ncbi:hypothetical protein GCM10009544_38060 [Streptomyces stramineus]|uniref:Uncharacterized protein n=1 Tax=Streptomyces stramineus TaxID=173861 RepID=A0ABN1ABQ2_9ACTN
MGVRSAITAGGSLSIGHKVLVRTGGRAGTYGAAGARSGARAPAAPPRYRGYFRGHSFQARW